MEVFEVFEGFRAKGVKVGCRGLLVHVCVFYWLVSVRSFVSRCVARSVNREGRGRGMGWLSVRDLLLNVFSVCANSTIERISS